MDIHENPVYGDCYFTSPEEGVQESRYVFIEGSGVLSHLSEEKRELQVGETGFGTTLNLLVLLHALKDLSFPWELTYYTVDKYPLSVAECRTILSRCISSVSREAETFFSHWEGLYNARKNGYNSCKFIYYGGVVRLHFYYGDVIDFMNTLPASMDTWFFDGHSPEKNPDMWSRDVLQSAGEKTRIGGTFATYTAAGEVKRGLRNAGFCVRRKKGFGKKHHMIYGYREA
ncbi:tRNA (5-methylaminomethyl-2-thiouridine)(34)-methyltransferase MnmD [Chitinivibrio alkaliphilus]|uniref:tRNA U-34 5-methylaminomethyl-2-thiouridine biosynthesis protein n=1 Tax=Chitinivibrio alkaliphilus ACht1 TaxID=1313304 RepID=U7D7P2_9BACT|nr:tRNA (5-methylaminomethyl-2-thiouridine)(34)-methyltransferase MnmD [Chitinivibrio alkaliphilus]ERP31953.1 tRNA U-34 5-methylaminomethyl-2-thiouridine biosynthesis protein [Chitinivibrio alkaliphilus ACht1]